MNLDKIKNESAKYDKAHQKSQELLTPRFKELVDTHGVSCVAAATGLAESSVLVYYRSKVVPISEYNVIKAEKILNKD